MPIVDLRGREDEPEVRALVESRHDWILIGWRAAGRLAACVAVERVDGDELAIRALGLHDDDAAQALLGEVARVAVAKRLVADVDEATSAIFLRSGFTVDGSTSGYALELDAQPAATHPAATLEEIETAIRRAWGRETSDDPDEWSPANPARGQCAVTALLVRELLGGEILVANVLRDGRRVDRHAWNTLPSGLVVDLTREQFHAGELFGELRVEEPVLTQRHPERFATLRARVRAELGIAC